MFKINSFHALDPLEIYLATPSGDLLYSLNSAIDEDSASLTPRLNGQFELVLTIHSQVADKQTGALVQTQGYEQIVEGMYFAVEKFGLFRASQPDIVYDGVIESKEIVAYSCDCELENLTLNNVAINMGTETSQEYLVTYEAGETESLVNEYTGIPYDWILLYNTLPQQLQELKEKYTSGYFGTPNTEITLTDAGKIAELKQICDLIPRLVYSLTKNTEGNITGRRDYVTYAYTNEAITKITLSVSFGFRIDELSIYYEKYHKQLSLLDIVLEKTDGTWTVGEVYGLSQGNYEVCNRKYQFDINEPIYSFLTQTLASTSGCVVNFDIIGRKVNIIPADKIGEYTGVFFSYDTLLNSINISCDETKLASRLYVYGADGLSIEYANIGQPFIEDLTYKMNARDSKGKRIYVSDELATKYQNYLTFWNEQRKPFMSLSREWALYNSEIYDMTYRVPLDSLKTNWGTFKKEDLEEALKTHNNLLATLITMYREDYGEVGLNPDGSVNETYIKTTEYWWDYIGYKHTITEIRAAIDTYPYYSNQNKWTETQIANWKDAITAWETEWSLYGASELQIKINSFDDKIKMLIDTKLVFRYSSLTDEIKPWAELTASERRDCGNIESAYNTSFSLYNECLRNKIAATEYLSQLQTKISEKEKLRDNVQVQRQAIKDKVDKSKFFTANERKVLNRFYRDAEYTNENILITSLDDAMTTVDVQNELVEDAKEKLSILSRPQLIFSVEAENLLALPEFAPLWDGFKLGNYIMLEYRDGTYIKQRMTAFTFNPVNPTSRDFMIEFSSYIVSASKIMDTNYLLGLAATEGISSYSSGGSGTGGGNLKTTLSDLMLSKLLNSETFGTRIKNVVLDTMTLNELTAQKAIFSGLNKGETSINGQWIKAGWITDASYNGDTQIGSITNTAGSIINLNDGRFSFAGGKLKWDGMTLHINGEIAWSNVTGTEHVATDADLNSLKSDITNTFSTRIDVLEQQTDKKVEVWKQDENPASNWTTSAERKAHEGDIWVYTRTQRLYIYNSAKNSWEELKPTPNDNIFTSINKKAQIFTTAIQPRPPYYKGDLWFQGVDKDIMTCMTTRTTGNYVSSDWRKFNKYTDDSSLKTFMDETYTKDINYLTSQLDGKIETFRQAEDPSKAWVSSVDRDKHKGDLWYNITTGVTYIYNGVTWDKMEADVPQALWDKVDGKANVFVSSTPTVPYQKGDLWFAGASKDIMTCIVSRQTGSFSSSDWVKYNKYTDDTTANKVKQEVADLEKVLGYDGTKLTGTYIYSPNILGGHLMIGDALGVHAEITTNGKLTATGADITGHIVAESGTFTGELYAETGTIGGFTITANCLYNGLDSLGLLGVYISPEGISCDDAFVVTRNGHLTAKEGNIAGFKFSSSVNDADHAYAYTLYRQIKNVYDSSLNEFFDYQAGIKAGSSDTETAAATEAAFYIRKKVSSATWADSTLPFYVRNNGYVYADEMKVGKVLHAESIELGGVKRSSWTGGDASVNILGTGVYTAEWTKTSDQYSTYLVLRPKNEGAYLSYLGDSTYRWEKLNCVKAPDVLSDRHLKSEVSYLDMYPNIERAFMELKPATYQLRFDSTNEKHYGFIAQDVEDAFQKYGVNCQNIGLINKAVLTKPNQAGLFTQYSLVYEEFIALNTHMIQKAYRRINELEDQNLKLANELHMLRGELSILQQKTGGQTIC